MCGLAGMRLRDFRIIRVQHGEIALQLVFEHAHFCVGVLIERAVAIEMIGRQIQQHTDLRTETFDGFQLKAADFGDRHGLVGGSFHQREQRRADVAADERRNVRRLQYVRYERCRGGLAVRAGDCDQLAAQEAPGQLDFAPDGNS